MAKLTRLATTVTARYYPAPDLNDAFYMDGRLSGKREARSADITIDKEDRGFLFSVFSHGVPAGHDPLAEPTYEAPLRKINNEAKTGRRPLMEMIGDCVNMAVAVTGRMKIQSGNNRAPFFSGAIVKESEVFAITMGKGLAFLYRDDTLFPLTDTDIRIDPINTQRQKVENFNYYCAGKIATAHCSHVLKLEMDDCLILCNREVYEALGQQEILRILFDAEDQCDAAGVIVTEASAKLPGVPMQFMISFVESVSTPEKSGIFGFGRKKSAQSYNDAEEAIEVPIARASAEAVPVASEPESIVPVIEDEIPAEPLFFGQDATNPFVLPLAEAPVVPTGPGDPIQIHDEPMLPYGEAIEENESQLDDAGFVKTTFDDADVEEAASFVQDDNDEDAFVTDAAEPENLKEQENTPEAPRYIPDDQDDDDTASLFFGDDIPSFADADTSSFVDDAVQEQATPSFVEPEVKTQGSSYYIPFASNEPVTPESSSVDDVPDMPLYDAPTYTPPAYPANNYSPQGYEASGVYARGSYSVDEDEDTDIRRAPSPRPSGRSYSYTPPQQTVPSYRSQMEENQSRPAQSGRPGSSAPQRRQPESKRYAQDAFDQDQNADYGEPDAAYKRNRFLTIGLLALSVICVIVLIGVFISKIAPAKPAETTAPSTSISSASDTAITETTTATTAAPVTDPSATTAAPGDINYLTNTPYSIFYFSDSTGFRTWWDVLKMAYNIDISSESDARIAFIIKYNNLPPEYVPKTGDALYLPDIQLLPIVTEETEAS